MKRISLLFVLLWSSLALAQSGGIPAKYMNDPAVDLVYKGKNLMPEEVDDLVQKSKGRFDISTLNPDESSDLWKDSYVSKLPEDKNPILDMDEVKYNSPVRSPSGIFRFNIINGADGKLYTMMISPNVHSVLLAKNLLRKIGYQIPDVKYLPRVYVKFKDKTQKEMFKSYMDTEAMVGDVKRWIIDEEDDRVLLQDLIVMDSVNLVYNLAVGVQSDMIQGRRILSSLAVPFAIVNLTESVNMLRWNAGVKNGNEIDLFLPNPDDFQCTWDDARWITRRIEKLKREDWQEIVAGTFTPKPVQQILVEKLISRRNSVMKLFKIDADEIKVDADISNGVELVHGKLTQKTWPGYGSRFAFGDPESPLSDSEMHSFIKSRVVSTAIDLAVAQINQIPNLGTDIQKLNEDQFVKYMNEAAKKAQQTNSPVEVPLKAWAFPTFRGQMIFSRNIVTGTYLGTDNLVQLVDTVGVSLSAGAFIGTMGLPSPIKLLGTAEAQFVRTYAHLRPVTSIQKSLKYPFKNIFIPLVKHDYGAKLYDAANVALDPNASDELKQKKIEDALKPFKDSMDIGESILISDGVAAQAGGKLSAGLDSKLLSASLGLVPGYNVLSRFHIHRQNEFDFQIYKDIGQEGSIGTSIDLDTLIPVLTVNFKETKGTARVKFYTLNVNPKNPDVIKNLSLLRKAVVSSSVKELDDTDKYKPYIVKHSFRENDPNKTLLFWQWKKQDSSTNISVTNPKGDERIFRRQYYGVAKGVDYQKYVNDTITLWVSLIWDRKAGLSGGGDTLGYSYKGHAETRYLTLDEEVSREGKIIEPFVKVTRIFNGWSIDRKKADKILEEMKQRYRYDFFTAPVLNDTRRIFLYNISLNVFLYKNGIDSLLSLKDDDIKKIFRENMVQTNLMINPANVEDKDTKANTFLRYMARFRKYEGKNDQVKANKYLLKAISVAEDNLNLKGLVTLVGGEENLYINSRIDGFREGDEAGDQSIVSNSIGEFGSANVLGPVVQLQKQTEMLEGEFFVYWMMSRLI